MIYLTYNDAPSGIYNSQVIDVVNYLNTLSKENVKLVSIISLRHYRFNKKKIKARCPEAIVIPMFPKARFWKLNFLSLVLITFFSKHRTIMARGPFATGLALRLKKNGLCKKIIFDARGAYHAELTEYNVVEDHTIINQIKQLERDALFQADYKLAVSTKLVDYWIETYAYNQTNHVIIPCTLSNDFNSGFPTEEEIKIKKQKAGFKEQDIIFIYSGSSAGWQSFSLVDELMCKYLKEPDTKLIILSNHFDNSYKVMQLFKEKITVLFVEPQNVKDYLQISDYGILFREQSITNKVASPVKFAEYMNSGLKVVISENLGDYSDFVIAETLQLNSNRISPVPYSEKIRINQLSKECFIKERFKEHYLKLLDI